MGEKGRGRASRRLSCGSSLPSSRLESVFVQCVPLQSDLFVFRVRVSSCKVSIIIGVYVHAGICSVRNCARIHLFSVPVCCVLKLYACTLCTTHFHFDERHTVQCRLMTLMMMTVDALGYHGVKLELSLAALSSPLLTRA